MGPFIHPIGLRPEWCFYRRPDALLTKFVQKLEVGHYYRQYGLFSRRSHSAFRKM